MNTIFKTIAFFSAVAVLTFSSAAELKAQEDTHSPSQVVLLYPEGQDSDKGLPEAQGPYESNGLDEPEEILENGVSLKVGDNARIELYFPERPNGQMVLVCPGGAYTALAARHEGLYVAEQLNSIGVAVGVVKYRMPNGHHMVPLTDIQNAFRYCRAHEAEWGIHQIGVMGFSAGGHLAASASTLFVDDITRPDFSILIYPVIYLEKKTPDDLTKINLLGKDKKNSKMIAHYSLDKQVTNQTPPAFLAHCTDDDCVTVSNSINYYEALVRCGVTAEMHIYPTGSHGWGFTPSDKNIPYEGGFLNEKGKDPLGYARDEFYASLGRWLSGLRTDK